MKKMAHGIFKGILFPLLILCFNASIAQTTITITANGTPGSFKTGSVNSTGTKNDGDMVTINTSSNRGWAVFDLSTLPTGVVITSANIVFTTFSSTLSTATNTIKAFTGNPATTAGATLYIQINSGTTINSQAWAANTTNTLAINAAGLTFLQTNAGATNVVIGFVRGSTNTYNITGYGGTSSTKPQLQITYLLPCTGTPSAGLINGPSSVCPNSSFTLSLGGQTIASGITYQWQSRPSSGGTFTNITGATASSLTTSITIATDYQCIVKCGPSNSSVITQPVSVAINSFYVCYCKSSLGGSTTASIDSIAIAETALHNGSAGTASSSYTQYPATGNMTADLQAGGLYFIYAKYGSNAIGSAWLDANHNGTYEAAEWVQINTSGTSATAILKVPPTATPGLTGLRIRSTASGNSNGASNACSNLTAGETEDYVVNIIPAPVNDLRIVSILQPKDSAAICPYLDVQMKAVIYNNGSNAQTGFPLLSDISGPVNNNFSTVHSNTLLPFSLDTVTLNTFNFPLAGNYSINVYTHINGDINSHNDTSINAFTIRLAPAAPIGYDDSVCLGNKATLYASADHLEHKWYNTSKPTTPVFTGDTLHIPSLLNDSTLYVTSQLRTFQSGFLTTINSGGNGCSGGAMFDVLPVKTLTIDSFAALFASTGNQSVSVYYKTGTFAGNETTPSAWILLGTANVNVSSSSTLTNFTVNAPLTLTGGNHYAIYVSYNATYTNGTNTFTNADMAIQTGTGLCSSFGGTNAGRMFNGTLYYSMGALGCESLPKKLSAIVGRAPTVGLGNDTTVCEGQTVTLDAGNPGAIYTWSNGYNTQTLAVKNIAGKYWVDVYHYCHVSDTVNINVDPLPKIGGISSTHQANNKFLFAAASVQYANSILWLFGDGTSSTDSITEHVYANDSAHEVKLIAFNDCGSDTASIVLPLDIRNISPDKENIKIYPNPANDKLVIDVAANTKALGVELMNSIGTVVYRNNRFNGKLEVNVSTLPVGNYLVRILTTDGVFNKKVEVIR